MHSAIDLVLDSWTNVHTNRSRALVPVAQLCEDEEVGHGHRFRQCISAMMEDVADEAHDPAVVIGQRHLD